MTISASIFRRTRNGIRARRYTIRLTLSDGTRIERAGYSDLEATRQLAARLVAERERGEVGLVDQFAGARRQPITEHIEDYLAALRAGNLARRRGRGRPTSAWVKRTEARLTMLFRELRASRLSHLEEAGIEATLVRLASSKGWSDKTRDHHVHLLRQFGAWLVDQGRSASNPFQRLRGVATDASRTFRRRALTVDEIRRLADAAEVRPVQRYRASNPTTRPEVLERLRRAGAERGLLYLVACYSGLRRREITSMEWRDLNLGPAPSIEVRPEIAKNRRRQRVQIPAWLGERIEQLRQARAIDAGGPPAPAARVFRASYRHLLEQLQADAVFAGLGDRDDRGRVIDGAGRVLDFHALRGTLATMAVAAGMTPKVLQQQMRHADVRTTLEVYAQVGGDEALRAEVDRLPRPDAQPPDSPPESRPAVSGNVQIRPDSENRRTAAT